LAENSDIVAAHLGAADDYAEASFAGLSPSVVTAFSEAAEKVAFAAPSGKWPLFDGYVAAGTPASLAARAYRGAIVLRELRGGVHTDAVRSAGLSPSVACQFDRDDFYFQMHGFGDDDKVEFTEAIEAMKRSVEDATNAAMAQLLGVLSDEEREALVVGTTALAEALR
jgi:hypothetical protein